mmetsp:Transcript_28330/g.39383  ORF Transcript_28330/g.39383 Transcript_28330/m.39383 type:complete len:349 (-) Transcript_28330:713-1759(-)
MDSHSHLQSKPLHQPPLEKIKMFMEITDNGAHTHRNVENEEGSVIMGTVKLDEHGDMSVKQNHMRSCFKRHFYVKNTCTPRHTYTNDKTCKLLKCVLHSLDTGTRKVYNDTQPMQNGQPRDNEHENSMLNPQPSNYSQDGPMKMNVFSHNVTKWSTNAFLNLSTTRLENFGKMADAIFLQEVNYQVEKMLVDTDLNRIKNTHECMCKNPTNGTRGSGSLIAINKEKFKSVKCHPPLSDIQANSAASKGVLTRRLAQLLINSSNRNMIMAGDFNAHTQNHGPTKKTDAPDKLRRAEMKVHKLREWQIGTNLHVDEWHAQDIGAQSGQRSASRVGSKTEKANAPIPHKGR